MSLRSQREMQINLQQIIYQVPWKRILLLLTLTICLSLTPSSLCVDNMWLPPLTTWSDIKEHVSQTTLTLLQGKSALKWLTFLKVIRPRNGFFCFKIAFLLTHSTWFLLLPDHDRRDISNPCEKCDSMSPAQLYVTEDSWGPARQRGGGVALGI